MFYGYDANDRILHPYLTQPALLDRFADIDQSTLQDPRNVAETRRFLLGQPAETVIPEVMVIPMRESSWP